MGDGETESQHTVLTHEGRESDLGTPDEGGKVAGPTSNDGLYTPMLNVRERQEKAPNVHTARSLLPLDAANGPGARRGILPAAAAQSAGSRTGWMSEEERAHVPPTSVYIIVDECRRRYVLRTTSRCERGITRTFSVLSRNVRQARTRAGAT